MSVRRRLHDSDASLPPSINLSFPINNRRFCVFRIFGK